MFIISLRWLSTIARMMSRVFTVDNRYGGRHWRMEKVDPDLAFGVDRGGEFRIQWLAVGLLQTPEHRPDQPDKVGLGEAPSFVYSRS
jgi:hypothetical protein